VGEFARRISIMLVAKLLGLLTDMILISRFKKIIKKKHPGCATT
jgi:hypothetical protein